jgi:hypothetical protein
VVQISIKDKIHDLRGIYEGSKIGIIFPSEFEKGVVRRTGGAHHFRCVRWRLLRPSTLKIFYM